MKIAYVYYLIQEKQLGVETKIKEQGRAIDKANIENLDIFVLNPSLTKTVGRVQYVKFNNLPFPFNNYHYLFQRYKLIEQTIPLQKYDYIILRYPLADQTGLAFTNKFNVITEHHTNELLEMRARWHETRSPIMKLARRILWQQEKKFAPQTLQNCKGIIAVSDGIRQFEVRRTHDAPPSITIGNGVDVTAVPHTGFMPFDNNKLDLLFLASSLRPWHGLDRVIRSFNQYQGDVQWQIHVVGNIGPEHLAGSGATLENVRFHGMKTRLQLDDILPVMHLAINTMGLHRIGLESVSPLKTCEYTARGLPFILAYNDPNLAAVKEEMRFFLSFENDESLVDVAQIIEFARCMSDRRAEIIAYMRLYASAHMDWAVKLQQYVDFVAEIDGRLLT